ncbi:MAG TPA: hypothetical protein VJA16_17795 [Thermoanaerobaculia bacterium]
MVRTDTILVVDDMEQNRALLASVVRSLGYQVETASDGLEALAKLDKDVERGPGADMTVRNPAESSGHEVEGKMSRRRRCRRRAKGQGRVSLQTLAVEPVPMSSCSRVTSPPGSSLSQATRNDSGWQRRCGNAPAEPTYSCHSAESPS